MKEPWGKAGERFRHHLAHHCADVAACFESLMATRALRSRLETAAQRPLDGTDIARLAVLAFWHDMGKLHPGFQAKAWPAGDWLGNRNGHLSEGAHIFGGVLNGAFAEALHVGTMRAWGVNEHLIFSILAHHGQPFELSPAGRKNWEVRSANGYDPLHAAREIGALLPHWFTLAFRPGGQSLPSAPQFQHLLCGLVSLADWLGSSEQVYTPIESLDRDYIALARARAGQAASQTGLDVSTLIEAVPSQVTFDKVAPGFEPREVQEIVADAPLDEQLVILESETGSGKTEAALWRFARLFAAGKVDGLYFALPTRAAAKQIHGRVHAAMKRLFGPYAPETVLAVPGYIKAGEHEGQALPNWRVRWDDDGGQDERNRLGRWAAESARRYLAAAVAVGTVDQVMLAGLAVKHAHLRSAALSKSLLVIDEIHASDPYMTDIQSHVLKIHLSRGGHALLMSATLGCEARVRWLTGRRRANVPAFEAAATTPYPAVWTSSAAAPVTAATGREKRVIMTLCDSWSGADAARLVLREAEAGARVLVIRNTVKAALETFNAVEEAGGGHLLWEVAGGPALHHSRFAPEDRRVLDDAVEHALGKSAGRREKVGVVVIGTQTLEQSLDIDADILITDLCPADVLLQRIGRLHRHQQSRAGGFEQPRCIVLSPEGGLDQLSVPAFDNGLGAWETSGGLQGVYLNLHACELTRRLVVEHDEWVIPAMNRALVEGAIHPDRTQALSDELGEAWANYGNRVYGQSRAEEGAAGRIRLQADIPFADQDLFPGSEEAIRTRLGADGAVIRFARPVQGPFGVEISSVTLPGHWAYGVDPETPAETRIEDGILQIDAGEKSFSYDRRGLNRGTA